VTFWEALRELILRSGQLPKDYDDGFLVFAMGSAIMGMAAIILDVVLFLVKERSIFSLTYKDTRSTIRLTLLWGLGSAIGSYFGVAMSILQLTRGGCIAAGVTWPLILPRIVDSLTRKEDVQPAEEEQS
jgi:hypothetical protein